MSLSGELEPRMIVTIFRSRLRPELQEEYAEVAARMKRLAESMPGFVAMKTFSAPDGERVTIAEFDSQERHDAWRAHPEHRAAQQMGRESFYSEYRIQVCEPIRDYSFLQEESQAAAMATPPGAN